MKKFFFIAVIVLLAATSCSNESESTVNNAQNENGNSVPVTVNVNEFSVSMEDFSDGTTRAVENPADYAGLKALILAFYTGDGTEVYKTMQTKGALAEGETFGNISLSLPMGSYTMVVLGYGMGSAGDDVLLLTSPTQAAYTTAHTRETFTATQTVNINSTNAVNLNVTLNRVVARLQVKSSDVRTANAASIRISFAAGSKAFNPTTGLASNNAGYSHEIPISTAVGAVSNSLNNIFLSSDEQEIDVTIETLDADGNVLFSKTVPDVPFKRNRATILTGGIYTNNSVAGAFTLETAWLSDYNMDF